MRHSTCFALAAMIALCSASVGHAIPQLINYQGILLDGGGSPVTTTTSVLFAIWDAPAAGDSLWSETQSVTPDADGRFNVLLGSVSSIPDSALAVFVAYLSMKVDADPEMAPRTQLVSVAYAYRPGTVDGAKGGNIKSKISIGGGHTNTGTDAFVAGVNNTVSGAYSTVGGGAQNSASDFFTTVGGGDQNTASGNRATVGGGVKNTANGKRSTIPGGTLNTASGSYSFAAGRRAKANHLGAFVWGDSTDADVASTKTNQFTIRAANGVRLVSNADPGEFVDVGERFRDNAIVAWGKVTGGGTLSAEFGVGAVVRNGTGDYSIVINAVATSAFTIIPFAQAEVESQGTIRHVSINQTGPQTFDVYINNGSNSAVDNDFVFMVTAR